MAMSEIHFKCYNRSSKNLSIARKLAERVGEGDVR